MAGLYFGYTELTCKNIFLEVLTKPCTFNGHLAVRDFATVTDKHVTT